MAMSTYKEYLLSTTSFNEPKVVSGVEAIATMLTRIILLEPGTNPLHPEMGVGLVSKYRYLINDKAKISLKENIRRQVETYLPGYQTIEVELDYQNDNTVDIRIRVDNNIFVYDSSEMVPISLSNIINNN